MLKIAIWHNLPSGGGKRALYYFVRGLAGRGHKLAGWSLDTADHSFLPLSEFVSEHIISSDFKVTRFNFVSTALARLIKRPHAVHCCF